MKTIRNVRQLLPDICGQMNEDDGLDPRKFFDKSITRKNDRKSRQLCAQTAETLNIILGGELQDDALFGLTVQEVEQSNHNQLKVKIVIQEGTNASHAHLILGRLYQLTGRFRREVASAISRKRVPELSFEFVEPP